MFVTPKQIGAAVERLISGDRVVVTVTAKAHEDLEHRWGGGIGRLYLTRVSASHAYVSNDPDRYWCLCTEWREVTALETQP